MGRIQGLINLFRQKTNCFLMGVKLLAGRGKAILLGNEAIVRGALESGVYFASTYPGTPASEIGDTFAEIAKQAGIYFEYSTNEKVALEAAAGAALSGVRSTVSFKQFGLNVASDSVMPLAYVGVKAGMVIVVADDPSCWSSGQSEQDSRYYARLAHIPMFEPSDAQECKDFMKIAFSLSEKFKLPMFLRATTRVTHMRGVVKLEKIVGGKKKGKFVKDQLKYRNFPPQIIKTHGELHGKLEKIKQFLEKSKLNFLVNGNVKSDIGIIVSGVSFNYIMDALDDYELKIPILKLGLTYPVDEKRIAEFIKKFESVLVVEELEPILEEEVRAVAKDVNPKLRILGKSNSYFPKAGEYTEELVVLALEKIFKKQFKINLEKYRQRYRKLKIARRFALMCPGCPHRATFYAAKIAAGKEVIFGGDIGCYILGIFPPLEMQDLFLSMGASEGLVHGIRKTTDQKAIAFVGDSTFFHAGFPGLVNAVYNKSNPLIIILDNRTTAMTGHQPHPGVGVTAMGEPTKAIAIEDVVRACKVENIKVVDPFNLKEMTDAVKEFLDKKEVSVIVAKRECQLLAVRKKRKAGIKIPKFEIDKSKCKRCGTCIMQFACPAIMKEGGFYYIDKDSCTGCGVCSQVCPNKAIHVVK
jgi:indolepyruvate ferredoxin oxidoreductase alpha subunit